MIEFVLYLRRVFCRHSWVVEEHRAELKRHGRIIREGAVVYMRCSICGYHQKHWKYADVE